MASEWIDATVSEIAAPVRNALVGGPFGSNLVSADYVGIGVPVIRGQNMGSRWVSGDFAYVSDDKADSLSGNLARPGDIVFTQRGTLGQVSIVPEGPFDRYLVSQSQMKLTVNTEVADPIFCYYQFRSEVQQDYIRLNAIQTGVPHTNLGILRNTPLLLPPLSEQRAIAHILGTLDDKIELNRRRNQTLEAMARALFQDWFVDFGPVRAKMECQEPYLPADLWQLFPDRLDDEGKPEGWEMGTLADFADLNPESWSKKNAPQEIEYVDLANTKLGTIESAARLSWSEAPSRAQRILRTGDTIVGTVRPGNGSYSLIAEDGLTGSTGFAVLRPKQSAYRELVFLAATSSESIERLSHLADGAAYPAVRPDVVSALPVAKPDRNSLDDLMKAFSKAAGKWIDSMEHNKMESKGLAQLRDTLLPKLISGELRIKDAEKFMERAKSESASKAGSVS